jgi:sialate O-acetylesterase
MKYINDFLLFKIFILLWFFLNQEATANIKLPAILADNMVLQQQADVGLWGWADPGEEVVIVGSWNPGKLIKATADPDGNWQSSIRTPKAGGPYALTFKGKNTIILQNVLLGEVWVCSGQSNMHFPVAPIENSGWATGVVNYQNEIANADYPEIRMFTVAREVADEPQQDAKAERGWEVSSPSTVGNFSAVAYFFGRELYKKTGFPVGLINTSWGGTPAESWMQKEVLESEKDFQAILERYQKAVDEYPEAFKEYEQELTKWRQEAEDAKSKGEKPKRAPKEPIGPNHNKSPYKLYNAMVAPLLPYTIKGVIWYQGESNADRAYQYRRLFPAMIRNWREGWGAEFPFYFAQIAPQRIMNPEIREAQLLTMLSVPKTGMAVLTDAGDSLDIHPKNKQIVGKRLALWALAKDYGKKKIAYSGPVYKSMEVQGNKVILKFDYADDGLIAKGGSLKEFTIAGKDQKFLPAKAKIKGKTIVVWNDQVTDPVAVRFAWRNVPDPNLYNASGLPASPFRTDDWPGETEGKIWFK